MTVLGVYVTLTKPQAFISPGTAIRFHLAHTFTFKADAININKVKRQKAKLELAADFNNVPDKLQ